MPGSSSITKSANASLRGYRAELEKLAGRQKRIVKAVMDGYSTDAMKDESNAIVRREQELKALLAEQKEAPTLLHPAMGPRYHAEVKNLIAAYHDKNHRTEAIEAVRSLVEKIVLTPDPESDGMVINLHGDLAGILNVAHKTVPLIERDLRQIRLLIDGAPVRRDVARARTYSRVSNVSGRGKLVGPAGASTIDQEPWSIRGRLRVEETECPTLLYPRS